VAELVKVAEPGDVVMTLGAGSVSGIAPVLVEALQAAHPD
jgi:UDP-N-acetylmuramate-alanine ligase